ncbi:MAG: nitroreductase family protein [Myxococcota bacterium]|nr:nitroreductase family protein [Myxococcota bacterium]
MISLLRTRRSIRRFKNTPIPMEKRALIEEALLRSPSSRSLNPWEFLFIDDPKALVDLARCKPHGASFLAQAPLGVAILADEAKCDVWIEDCSIAAFIAHAAAHSMGLGSCWIQIRLRPHGDDKTAEAFIQARLGIPVHIRVLAIVAIGYPDEEKAGHPSATLDRKKIRYNQW